MKNILLVLVMSLFIVNCTTVDPGNVGVETCWGQLEDKVYNEGFYWTMFCNINELTVRTQNYTMAGAGREAQADGSVQVLTRDQLSVVMDVSVQFHLNGQNVVKVYRFLGNNYASDIVHPLVRTAVRDAASEFNAMALVDNRGELQTRMEVLVRDRLTNTLNSRQIPTTAIVIDSILLRNIDLPDSLENSIANVQRQRQETAQREQAAQTATQEANRLRIEAEGASQAMLTRTRADTEALLLRARAQAEANRTIAQSLTPEVLRLRQIEAMTSVLSNNNTRVIMVPTGQSPTFLMPAQ